MSLPEFDVTGQKVLIVGAGRGIGKGIALAFAEAGADVAIASLTASTVGKVAEEIRAMGRTALPVTGDAIKPPTWTISPLRSWPSSGISTLSSLALGIQYENRWSSCRALRKRA